MVQSTNKSLVKSNRTPAFVAPADNIDVQSFIWVAGGYTDADLPPEVE